MVAEAQKVKISSPERVARILQRVAQGGIAVQIRSLAQIETAVKGRAVSSGTIISDKAFSLAGVSDRGRLHLQNLSNTGVQVEFVLMSVKVVFVAKILNFSGNGLTVSIPEYLTSIERRKDERFAMSVSARAYIQLDDWYPELKDTVAPPFFEYQRDLATLVSLGDISMGGLSLVSRFPALCKILQRGVVIENSKIMFPLHEAIPAMFEVRWTKRLRETVQDFQGVPRTFRVYKYGIQLINPSSILQSEIQRFIAKIATAEAI